jgi:hypothetical protein
MDCVEQRVGRLAVTEGCRNERGRLSTSYTADKRESRGDYYTISRLRAFFFYCRSTQLQVRASSTVT